MCMPLRGCQSVVEPPLWKYSGVDRTIIWRALLSHEYGVPAEYRPGLSLAFFLLYALFFFARRLLRCCVVGDGCGAKGPTRILCLESTNYPTKQTNKQTSASLRALVHAWLRAEAIQLRGRVLASLFAGETSSSVARARLSHTGGPACGSAGGPHTPAPQLLGVCLHFVFVRGATDS